MSRRRRGLQQRDLSGLVGETVLLPCHVDTQTCGTVHSVKWYRGSSRIFVFSEMAGVNHAEGDYVDRADLHYQPNATQMHLSIKRLAVVDEAMYKCEITYNEVKDGCVVVQFINLTTMIKPQYVKITREDTELQNSTLIGPFSEGDDLSLSCESGGGKPIPTVAWFNGSAKISGDYTTEPGPNGAGTGRNTVRLALSRGDLGARFECRASNDALDSPMVASVEVDVNVRPLALELTGVDQHVVQGSSVTLQCVVSGARPSATVTWYNGTEPLDLNRVEIKDNQALQLPRTRVVDNSDGTHDTVSELVFTATRYENGESLTCEATNEVLQQHSEPPMRKTIALEVMYPPIVSVTPDNVTVNESMDILLFCQYEANPATLKSVKWRRDGEPIVLERKDHYEGGTPDQTTLLIKNSTRHDHGLYTCELENSVGRGNSSNGVYVNIQFRPIVRLEMDPPTPVSELAKMNITLICRVEAGNPETLTEVHWYKDGELVDPDETLQAVRWLLDGELLKELPDCNSTAMGDSFCDVDPSKLLLEAVERSFHGNYSCEGANEAGWGPVSEDTQLIVYYPPGPAELTHEPQRVVKNSVITLSCAVSDLGRPPTTIFRWLRNSAPINNITSANWTVNPVTLRTRSNFTCLAVNEGGEGESATAEINVLAPPAFIERLVPYEGALFNATHINISCQVECQPLCDVNWLKNGQPVEMSRGEGVAMYSVRNVVVDPDYNRGDFESIRSTLIWNMVAWPGGQLDRVHDNANYTCQSSGNEVGIGVKSTTIFAVEYPPENITVSKQVVSVVESRVPEMVLCSARAYPEAMYEWRAENSTDENSVTKRNKLILNKSMNRKDSGYWTCTAFNRHGSVSTTIRIDVQYKPECSITSEEVDGQLVLTCLVRANPDQVGFTWRIENSNETVEENVVSQGLRSRLTLDTRAEDTRTYLCYATNSVGTSFPCERGVQAHYKEKSSKLASGNLSWWKRLENDNLMIIIAVVVSTIIMVLIICVIIILVCRRKRAADKYNNPVELEERQNYERFVANLYGQQLLYPEGDASGGAPDGAPSPTAIPASPTSPSSPANRDGRQGRQHKWPLRPGVMVHVNGAHSLSLSRLPDHLNNNNNNNSSSNNNNNCSSTPALNPPAPKKQKRRKRAASLTTLALQPPGAAGAVGAAGAPADETNQHSRANRIRQMFSNCDQNGRNSYSSKRGETLPGVFPSKAGVVTFKRLDESANPGGSRKRKKPGAGPNPTISKDKAKDRNNAPNDALLQPDTDGKAFYENLPFHGIQNAPNKPEQPPPAAPPRPARPASRPASELSQYDGQSSGYGSSRSTSTRFSSLRRNLDGNLSEPDLLFRSLRLPRDLHPPAPAAPRAAPGFRPLKPVRAHSTSLCVRPAVARPLKQAGSAPSLTLGDTLTSTLTSPALVASVSPRTARAPRPAAPADPATPVNINPNCAVHGDLARQTPPTPAPRKAVTTPSKPTTAPSKHTYQNVPIPIVPNTSSARSTPSPASTTTTPTPESTKQLPAETPYRPEYSDLDYADVDYRSYGPINYKAASILAAQQDGPPGPSGPGGAPASVPGVPSGLLAPGTWRPPPPPEEDYL